MTVSHTIKVSYYHTHIVLDLSCVPGRRRIGSSWYWQGEIFIVLGIQLSGPILSEPSRTTFNIFSKVGDRAKKYKKPNPSSF
jgi:hypothetical protein